ncbi:MAG: TROVE domain-containing protein [Frankiales bacterium]|nr:TROVE domain-containing protein [Frankiales bacterium]
MSKFNRRRTRRTGVSAVRTADRGTAYTFEGAPGYARDPKSELFLLAVTSMVGEDTFYEAAGERDSRLRDLIARVAVEDFEWTLGLVGWLRNGALLRSVATVAAAEAVHARLAAGESGGNRALVRAALVRADEPGEFLGYWTSRYGRRLPQPVKRGLADAVVNLYTERSLVKYDGDARGFRFADVIELVHPAPRDARQAALFRHALDRRHDRPFGAAPELPLLAARQRLLALPAPERRAVLTGSLGDPTDVLAQAGMTWEALAGWLQGPLDAVAWEAVIPAMGYMALLRNLRNFDEAGVSDRVATQVAHRLADGDEVARSRQLPLRFLSAYRAAPSLRWAWALERALQASLANVPALPGRTLVLVDRSGSMFAPLSRRAQVNRADAAAVFGTALALRARAADLVEFGTSSQAVRLRKGASVLAVADGFGNLGGTNTAAAVRRHYAGHDRVVLVTDEQAWAGPHGANPTAVVPADVPVYTFNLAGYRYGHGPSGVGNRHTFGGLTDQAFAAIPLLESGRDHTWPF